MLGFRGCCAAAGVPDIVTAASDANRPSQILPAILMVYLLSIMA
jgi:hypothetical protein